jgi:hypothetical protein
LIDFLTEHWMNILYSFEQEAIGSKGTQKSGRFIDLYQITYMRLPASLGRQSKSVVASNNREIGVKEIKVRTILNRII